MDKVYTRFQTKTEQKPYPLGGTYQYRLHYKVVPTPEKQPPTLLDTTNGFPAKRRLRNNCKTSNRWRVTTQNWVAKIHRRTTSQKHNLDLRSHVIAVEFLQLFLKRHFERKPETSRGGVSPDPDLQLRGGEGGGWGPVIQTLRPEIRGRLGLEKTFFGPSGLSLVLKWG